MAQTAPTGPTCDETHHAEFDFWVGEWNVYSRATEDNPGTYLGHNRVEKRHSNCLISENWTSATGGTGESMNFFDPFVNQWRQVWTGGGWTIDYTGGLNEDGAMVLTGRVHALPGGTVSDFRGTWALREDGTVSQFFEQKNAEGEWQASFLGIYVRVENDARAEESEAARLALTLQAAIDAAESTQ
ncbi:MAG: hypothetical protein P8P99_15495 [Maricaulis sp.]|nr:hypothetical protein [Maricaulis sp.]